MPIQPPRISPKGILKLLLFLLALPAILMVASVFYPSFWSLLESVREPGEPPFDQLFLRRFVWVVVVGLLIGIAIRLARKV